jgi:hypothetical protein
MQGAEPAYTTVVHGKQDLSVLLPIAILKTLHALLLQTGLATTVLLLHT